MAYSRVESDYQRVNREFTKIKVNFFFFSCYYMLTMSCYTFFNKGNNCISIDIDDFPSKTSLNFNNTHG